MMVSKMMARSKLNAEKASPSRLQSMPPQAGLQLIYNSRIAQSTPRRPA